MTDAAMVTRGTLEDSRGFEEKGNEAVIDDSVACRIRSCGALTGWPARACGERFQDLGELKSVIAQAVAEEEQVRGKS